MLRLTDVPPTHALLPVRLFQYFGFVCLFVFLCWCFSLDFALAKSGANPSCHTSETCVALWHLLTPPRVSSTRPINLSPYFHFFPLSLFVSSLLCTAHIKRWHQIDSHVNKTSVGGRRPLPQALRISRSVHPSTVHTTTPKRSINFEKIQIWRKKSSKLFFLSS